MKRYRSHPADVTADRLGDHYEKWFERLSGYERDAFVTVIQVLREIAEGQR